MVIGITGGVGCGKSSVLHHLEEQYHAIVLEADKIAHQLMEPGEDVYRQVVAYFGTDILDGEWIDRKKLGAIVFGNRKKLEALNEMVHPAVKQYIMREAETYRGREKSTYAVVEAALLFEDHYEAFCDEVWYIYANEEVRFRRLQESRGYSPEKTKSIMQNQMDEKTFREKSDFVIDNSEDFTYTERQIKQRLSAGETE